MRKQDGKRMVRRIFIALISGILLIAACTGNKAELANPSQRRVALIIDSGSANDRSFNEYTLRGAQRAAEEAGLEFFHREPQSITDYEAAVESTAREGANLIITVGFRMGDATSKAARRHPDIHFVIVDNAYTPGVGCPKTVTDCYSEAGGLNNVTSLMFAEDQVGYLAGVLAGCMSKSGKIASVAGVELPPVVRFVTGFQKGARSINPQVVALNQYIPDFNDPQMGEVVAQGFINEGVDILFGVGGNTGNGALLAAHKAGLMAIGVDVDQYFTYPEIKSSLITSASKNVDQASASAVSAFADGTLEPGIRLATLANSGVGLAPYHDWEDRILEKCKLAVEETRQAVIANPSLTGVK
jgi:basic membrane protein A